MWVGRQRLLTAGTAAARGWAVPVSPLKPHTDLDDERSHGHGGRDNQEVGVAPRDMFHHSHNRT